MIFNCFAWCLNRYESSRQAREARRLSGGGGRTRKGGDLCGVNGMIRRANNVGTEVVCTIWRKRVVEGEVRLVETNTMVKHETQ